TASSCRSALGQLGSALLAGARWIPNRGDPRSQDLAAGWPDRRGVRRSQPGVRLPAGGSVRNRVTAGRPDGPMAGWTIFVEPEGRCGRENMAADEALLEEVIHSGGAFLRLYRWDPPTLSVGRNQSLDGAGAGIPIVRRPTGGQAV